VTEEKWLHELSGISFEEAQIDGLKGALIITHFGISGPLAFMLSAELAWVEIGKGKVDRPSFSPIASM
jgi:predicted flavoprotein YhiN